MVEPTSSLLRATPTQNGFMPSRSAEALDRRADPTQELEPLTPADTLRTLEEARAIQHGHFRYESGRHGPQYVEKFRLLERPGITKALCAEIAKALKGHDATIVAGPSTGGILLAHETAAALDASAFFAEPNPAGRGRIFGRGFEFPLGARVIVVDDVLTTGGSIRDTIDAVREAGGEPVGVGVIVDRTNGRTTPRGLFDDLPFFACLSIDVPSYAPGECPLCVKGIELTET